jgi:predicted DNA-binding WGR domain protein
MMELRKIDPAKNMRRFYRLSVEPTLFGDYALVREWGRIGAKRGQSKEEWLGSESDADDALAKALKYRLGRGYQLSMPSAQGALNSARSRDSNPVKADGEIQINGV